MFHIAAAGFVDVRFLYAGYQYDKRLGLYHVRHRVYHPHLGRWLQPDPLGYIDGWNLYAYVGSSPMSMVDPWGLWGDTWFGRAAHWIQEQTNDLGAIGRVAGQAIAVQMHMVDTAVGAVSGGVAALIDDPVGAVTGVVQAPYERAVTAHENAYGQRPGPLELVVGIAGELTGMSSVAAGSVGFDPVENRGLDFYERSERIAIGVATAAGGAAGAVKLINVGASAGVTAGQNFVVNIADDAAGAASKGKTTVYRSLDDAGNVQYVGITDDLARRQVEHLRKSGMQIVRLMHGLSRDAARGVEQALIQHHGLGKHGGTLRNKINSIAPKNPKYSNLVDQGCELLESIGYYSE